jgi:hypothetical protein
VNRVKSVSSTMKTVKPLSRSNYQLVTKEFYSMELNRHFATVIALSSSLIILSKRMDGFFINTGIASEGSHTIDFFLILHD